MLNGDGLRVVLWVSGCSHHCEECHNPITWDVAGGIPFLASDKAELWEYLQRDYTAGITFSGGDPLHPSNRDTIYDLVSESKTRFPGKTVWIYTGYLWEEIADLPVMQNVDVLVDGEYKKELHDNNIHWCGSSNQRVINVPESLRTGTVILWEEP